MEDTNDENDENVYSPNIQNQMTLRGSPYSHGKTGRISLLDQLEEAENARGHLTKK